MATSKKRTNEGLTDLAASAESDHELQMARSQLYKIASYAIKLHEMMKEVTDPNGIEAWQSAKITKASDYMGAVYHDLEYKLKVEQGGELGAEAGEIAVGEEAKPKKKYGKMKETSDPYVSELRGTLRHKLAEKAVSQSQQQAAGIALKHKREGTKPKEGSAAAEMMSMSKSDLEDFAGTKHKGLPDKKESTNEAPYRGSSNRYGGSMGGPEKRDFKRREMEKELGNEKTPKAKPYYLAINDKTWWKNGKPVSFKTAQAASNAGHSMIRNNPDRLSGENVKLTRNPNLGRE